MWKSETRTRVTALAILVLIVLIGVAIIAIQANSNQIAADTLATLDAAKTATRLTLTPPS